MYAKWVESIGRSAIEKVTLGDSSGVIQSHSGELLDMWHALTLQCQHCGKRGTFAHANTLAHAKCRKFVETAVAQYLPRDLVQLVINIIYF